MDRRYYQLTSRPSLLNNCYGNNARTCFMYKKGDYQLIRYTKEEYNKVREEFKRYIYQYLANNNINNNFNKDIVLTITSSNFFYNNYSVKYFIILNRLILIKTAKNIVIFINNNIFTYSLTSNIKPNTIKLSIVRYNNISNKSNNNRNKSATVMALVNCRQIIVNCRYIMASCYYITRELYITLSSATTFLLFFLQLQIFIYK